MQTYKNCFYVYPKKKITLVENKNIVLTIIFTKYVSVFNFFSVEQNIRKGRNFFSLQTFI